jgi:eukaryotic-like serine/threonine-protein kinase
MNLEETLRRAVADRYAVRGELGRGGMGAVFLAEDLRRGGEVAIKVLAPEFASSVGPGRFLREIRILSGLTHPNILPVLDSQASGSLMYFVMPYVAGDTLRTCLRVEGVLPLERALDILGDLAAAADYAHSRNIIHRDLKPENVLLEGSRALVCDFGVARAIVLAAGESVSSGRLVLGTAPYMSPEQAMGGAVDERCDVYAVGCVLYEMLAGEPPFSGPTAQAVLARQLNSSPRSLRLVRPELTAAMEAAVLSALERSPDRRPSSAGELLRRMRA